MHGHAAWPPRRLARGGGQQVPANLYLCCNCRAIGGERSLICEKVQAQLAAEQPSTLLLGVKAPVHDDIPFVVAGHAARPDPMEGTGWTAT
jgi:hypothetical protein